VRFARYLFSRLVTYFLVIWIGMTVIFFVPRFLPSDPVTAALGRVMSSGSTMRPEEVQAMRNTLMQLYGLEGTLPEQYFNFMKRAVFGGSFGPSLAFYPTPVNALIGKSLPWTLFLLLTSTLIAWVIGNLIGLLAGYQSGKIYSKVLEGIAIFLYPIPYYILALILIILFVYINPIFPVSFNVQRASLSPEFIYSAIFNSVLPALSIIVGAFGWWVLSMKALSAGIAEEDYVSFARLKGVGEPTIMGRYIMRNAILPQITQLALNIGTIFNGALITEILFGYPGLGTLTYTAVVQSDYNLLMGTISIGIIAVATAALVVDLLYPLFDPRIEYR
jgi:peptide/nickel transport system permease protein